MDGKLAARATTIVIIIIIIVILALNRDDLADMIKNDTMLDKSVILSNTDLVCNMVYITDLQQLTNNKLLVEMNGTPHVNSQLYIQNIFIGNVVAYTISADKKMLIMDRGVDIPDEVSADDILLITIIKG